MNRRVVTILVGTLLALGLPFAGAHALTLTKPIYDYTLNPGDTKLDIITLRNEGTVPLKFYPIIENFRASEDESGTPQFYPADEVGDGTGMASWIKVNATEIELKPGELQNVPFAINVPEAPQPGGHYGAIIMSTAPPGGGAAQGGEVGLSAQIASLILVRTPGDVKEAGSIAEYGFQVKRTWYESLPVDFFFRFENSGNTHLRPVGNLLVTDWFGHQVASVEVNGEFKGILPRSIRRFETGWARAQVAADASPWKKEWENFAIGKYTATLALNYGQQTNQTVAEERVFYVWPWRLMIVFALAFVGVLAGAYGAMKVHNRRVIRRFQKATEKETKT